VEAAAAPSRFLVVRQRESVVEKDGGLELKVQSEKAVNKL